MADHLIMAGVARNLWRRGRVGTGCIAARNLDMEELLNFNFDFDFHLSLPL